MADPSATTDIASSYTFLGNNLTDMMLPINVTADLQSEVILGENNQTKIPNVLILTTSMKGMIMFYNTIVIVIGVFGNIGVLYLSMKHSEYWVEFTDFVLFLGCDRLIRIFDCTYETKYQNHN